MTQWKLSGTRGKFKKQSCNKQKLEKVAGAQIDRNGVEFKIRRNQRRHRERNDTAAE